MKHTLSALRLLLVTASLIFMAAFPTQAVPQPRVPSRDSHTFLVKFKPGTTASVKRSINSANGAALRSSIHQLDVDVLSVPRNKTAEQLVQNYKQNPNVAYAEPNFIASVQQSANDPYYSIEWHLSKIQAPLGWDVTTGSDNVTVAIIDTGVDATHPDLAARLVAGYDFVNNDSDPTDDHGHGTSVAGVLGAVTNNGQGVAGITWSTKLMPVKVLGADGSGTYSNIAKGVTYAVDKGVKIINLSLGGSASSSTMKSAVDYAASKGAIVVAASGNSGGPVMYPAAYDNAVAVGASDTADAKASFSSYGPQLDLVAPGVSIYATARGGGYTIRAGTSFASPLTAGLAALVLAENPTWSNKQIVEQLQNSADDLGAPGRDDYFGYGRLNVSRALGAGTVADTSPPAVTLLNPKPDATVSGSLELAAEASDNVAVSRVEFLVDGAPIGSVGAGPYSLTWDSISIADGAHTVAAKATDSSGNTAQSAANIVIDNSGSASSQPAPTTYTFSGSVGGRSASLQGFDLEAGGSGQLSANLAWSGKAVLDLVLLDKNGTVLEVASGAKPEYLVNDLPGSGLYALHVISRSGKANFTLQVSSP